VSKVVNLLRDEHVMVYALVLEQDEVYSVPIHGRSENGKINTEDHVYFLAEGSFTGAYNDGPFEYTRVAPATGCSMTGDEIEFPEGVCHLRCETPTCTVVFFKENHDKTPVPWARHLAEGRFQLPRDGYVIRQGGDTFKVPAGMYDEPGSMFIWERT
jgi:hypothetical protein